MVGCSWQLTEKLICSGKVDNKWMNIQTASVEFAMELCSWLKSGIGGGEKKDTFLTNAVAHKLSSFHFVEVEWNKTASVGWLWSTAGVTSIEMELPTATVRLLESPLVMTFIFESKKDK